MAVLLALVAGPGQGPAPAAAQETPAAARVAAQRLPDGRVEVALQVRPADGAWGARRLPQRRYLPTGAEPGRWLHTTPVTLDEGELRVAARRLPAGRVEVALQIRSADGAWGARLLPERRFVAAAVAAGRWLSSSPVTLARAEAQIVSFYGHPGVPVMGALGDGPPGDVAARVAAWAERYDRLNGPRGVIPAFHLIVGVAQNYPAADGSWLNRLSRERVAEYVEAARDHDMLLFLDTQIGWSDPLEEVRLLEEFLREPFVHVALDPEFATEPEGVRPGLAIGSIGAEQVNEVQRYLAALVREGGLPSKILMVHQFVDGMLRDRDAVEDHDGVDLSIDMDGFGRPSEKLRGYELYALPPPSERPAFKLFFSQDLPVMTPEEVQALDRPPDVIIYQ